MEVESLYMDKYEFLKACSKYGGVTRELYVDYGKSVVDTYNRLIENGEITLFHGFVCLVSRKLDDNTYALVPYTGEYRELQEDSAFTEYHSWRAEAEKKECYTCGRIYFASNEDDSCPYCAVKK